MYTNLVHDNAFLGADLGLYLWPFINILINYCRWAKIRKIALEYSQEKNNRIELEYVSQHNFFHAQSTHVGDRFR